MESGFRWTNPRKWALAFSIVALLLATGNLVFYGRVAVFDAYLAVLTATLIAVIWYTAFTYESLEQSRQAALAANRSIRIALGSRARRLLDALEELPKEKEKAETMRLASLWEPHELNDLVTLSAAVHPLFAGEASKAVVALRGLADRVRKVQNTSKGHGVDWERGFPWDDYLKRLKDADKSLLKLVQAGTKAWAVEGHGVDVISTNDEPDSRKE